MMRLMICILQVIVVICFPNGASADGERKEFDALSTYGVEPTIIITAFASDKYSFPSSASIGEIENCLGVPFCSYESILEQTVPVYIAEIEGMKTQMSFHFDEKGRLDYIALAPIPTMGGATSDNYEEYGMKVYHQYYNLFTREFGEPAGKGEVRWLDDTYRDIPEMKDYAFESGNFVYESVVWMGDKLGVSSIMMKDSMDLVFIIEATPAEGWFIFG